jgi:hypothetical protein
MPNQASTTHTLPKDNMVFGIILIGIALVAFYRFSKHKSQPTSIRWGRRGPPMSRFGVFACGISCAIFGGSFLWSGIANGVGEKYVAILCGLAAIQLFASVLYDISRS